MFSRTSGVIVPGASNSRGGVIKTNGKLKNIAIPRKIPARTPSQVLQQPERPPTTSQTIARTRDHPRPNIGSSVRGRAPILVPGAIRKCIQQGNQNVRPTVSVSSSTIKQSNGNIREKAVCVEQRPGHLQRREGSPRRPIPQYPKRPGTEVLPSAAQMNRLKSSATVFQRQPRPGTSQSSCRSAPMAIPNGLSRRIQPQKDIVARPNTTKVPPVQGGVPNRGICGPVVAREKPTVHPANLLRAYGNLRQQLVANAQAPNRCPSMRGSLPYGRMVAAPRGGRGGAPMRFNPMMRRSMIADPYGLNEVTDEDRDFIDDGPTGVETNPGDWLRELREFTGYDPSRFSQLEDEAVESSMYRLQDEERLSELVGRREDLEEYRKLKDLGSESEEDSDEEG